MLDAEILAYWGLTGQPFNGRYLSLPGHTRARQKLNSVAKQGGIAAITGPFGAGKTTLLRDWMGTQDPARLLFCRPPGVATEKLTVSGLLAALLLELSPAGNIPNGVLRAAIRLRQQLAREQKQVVLLIEEAHALPRNSLLACKRLLEIEDVPRIGIILVGQSALADNLRTNIGLGEVGFRTEIIRLEALIKALPDYCRAQFQAAGRTETLLTRSAYSWLRANATTPLQINRILERALEFGHEVDATEITDDVIVGSQL